MASRCPNKRDEHYRYGFSRNASCESGLDLDVINNEEDLRSSISHTWSASAISWAWRWLEREDRWSDASDEMTG